MAVGRGTISFIVLKMARLRDLPAQRPLRLFSRPMISFSRYQLRIFLIWTYCTYVRILSFLNRVRFLVHLLLSEATTTTVHTRHATCRMALYTRARSSLAFSHVPPMMGGGGGGGPGAAKDATCSSVAAGYLLLLVYPTMHVSPHVARSGSGPLHSRRRALEAGASRAGYPVCL